MAHVSHAGRLLVATPAIGDPNFERTVVFLLDHDEEGALGLVLNRPSDLEAAEVMPGWSDLAARPGVVFSGGPVEQEGIIGLGRRRDEAAGPFQTTVGTIGVIDLDAQPVDAIGAVDGIRLFAGYAGWGAGQLEAELLAQGWWIVDADPADALTDEPGGLWNRVLRRQPEPLRRWGLYPPDVSLN